MYAEKEAKGDSGQTEERSCSSETTDHPTPALNFLWTAICLRTKFQANLSRPRGWRCQGETHPHPLRPCQTIFQGPLSWTKSPLRSARFSGGFSRALAVPSTALARGPRFTQISRGPGAGGAREKPILAPCGPVRQSSSATDETAH